MDGMDFGEIYEKYYCLVVKIAYDIIGDFYLAQDITQDVYASLYEKIDQIDIDRVKGWLITCASHIREKNIITEKSWEITFSRNQILYPRNVFL